MSNLHSHLPAQNPLNPPPARPGLGARLLAEGERLLAAHRPAEALPLLQAAAQAQADGPAWRMLGARAVAAAHDLPALAELRAGMRARMKSSPLMDAPRFATNFAAALRHAWRLRCAQTQSGAGSAK